MGNQILKRKPHSERSSDDSKTQHSVGCIEEYREFKHRIRLLEKSLTRIEKNLKNVMSGKSIVNIDSPRSRSSLTSTTNPATSEASVTPGDTMIKNTNLYSTDEFSLHSKTPLTPRPTLKLFDDNSNRSNASSVTSDIPSEIVAWEELTLRFEYMNTALNSMRRYMASSLNKYSERVTSAMLQHHKTDLFQIHTHMQSQLLEIEQWMKQYECEANLIESNVEEIVKTINSNHTTCTCGVDDHMVEPAAEAVAIVVDGDNISVMSSGTPLSPFGGAFVEHDHVVCCVSPCERTSGDNCSVEESEQNYRTIGTPKQNVVIIHLGNPSNVSNREDSQHNHLALRDKIFANLADLLVFVSTEIPSYEEVEVRVHPGKYTLDYQPFFVAQTKRISFLCNEDHFSSRAVIRLNSTWKLEGWLKLNFKGIQIQGFGEQKLFISQSIPRFENCVIKNCRFDLNLCKDIVISGCDITGTKNKPGIKLFKSVGALLKFNRISSCGNAIEINTCVGVDTRCNVLLDNEGSGVYLYVSSDNRIEQNNIGQNYRGITIATQTSATIVGNELSNNKVSIEILDPNSKTTIL